MILKINDYNKWYMSKKFRGRVDYLISDAKINENIKKIYSLILAQLKEDYICVKVSVEHNINNYQMRDFLLFEEELNEYEIKIDYIYNYDFRRLLAGMFIERKKLSLDIFEKLLIIYDNVEFSSCDCFEEYKNLISTCVQNNRLSYKKDTYLISVESDYIYIKSYNQKRDRFKHDIECFLR